MHVRDPLFQHLPTRKETAVVYQQQIAASLLVVSLSFPLFDKVLFEHGQSLSVPRVLMYGYFCRARFILGDGS